MRRVLSICLALVGCGRIGFDATTDAGTSPDALPLGRWQSVASSGDATCAIDVGGGLWCWGNGNDANLGNGSVWTQDVMRVGGFTDFTRVAMGITHTCALRGAGTLWCWGWNLSGAIPGVPPDQFALDPLQIGTASWTQIAASDSHTCGIQADDSLWCWGEGTYGTLGTGSTTNQPQPVRISAGVDRWLAVTTAQFSTCGIQTDNTLWCWGYNNSGQVGNGTTTTQLQPVPIGAGRTWIAVDADWRHTCAIEQGGAVWCWGDTFFAQLGDTVTSTAVKTMPVRATAVPLLATIDVGLDHSCGTTAMGEAYCWGRAERGQIGVVLGIARMPVKIATAATVVIADGHTTCWIDDAAHLFCAGGNNYGQAGPPAGEEHDLVQSDPRTDWTRVYAAQNHACAKTTTDRLYCWGLNSHGELGYARPEDSQAPQDTGQTFDEIALGGDIGGARGLDGSAWVSGLHLDLATESLVHIQEFGPGSTKTGALGDSHGCRILSDDSLRCGGYNGFGQIGDGTNTSKPTVGLAGTWRVVAAGYQSTCGVTLADVTSCWGQNSSGQLGIGTTTDANTPQALSFPVGVVPAQIGIGLDYTCARMKNGEIWCWGDGNRGQLGNGVTGGSLVPQRVGSRTDWQHLAVGDWHACAIATDRSMWCWGHGDQGQLGPPFGPTRTSPTQIGGAEWLDVAAGGHFTCALKLDGTRWCFGANPNGELGNGRAWREQFTVIP